MSVSRFKDDSGSRPFPNRLLSSRLVARTIGSSRLAYALVDSTGPRASASELGVTPNPCPKALEIPGLADQTKNEPEFELPEYVLNLPQDEQLMAIIAPDYECEELLARVGRKNIPIAA